MIESPYVIEQTVTPYRTNIQGTTAQFAQTNNSESHTVIFFFPQAAHVLDKNASGIFFISTADPT
jgi:hypothetical protein